MKVKIVIPRKKVLIGQSSTLLGFSISLHDYCLIYFYFTKNCLTNLMFISYCNSSARIFLVNLWLLLETLYLRRKNIVVLHTL